MQLLLYHRGWVVLFVWFHYYVHFLFVFSQLHIMDSTPNMGLPYHESLGSSQQTEWLTSPLNTTCSPRHNLSLLNCEYFCYPTSIFTSMAKKILALNKKGLNHPAKRSSLWHTARQSHCNILFIQETHFKESAVPPALTRTSHTFSWPAVPRKSEES